MPTLCSWARRLSARDISRVMAAATRSGTSVPCCPSTGALAPYAHLQRANVKVTAGSKVKSGDLLGKVGNTGNTSAPHLHFHVMDGPSPLLSNGIPYIISHFKMTAIDKAGTADFDNAEANGTPLSLTPFNPPLQKSNV